ncbi:MAG: hydrogen peroxide-inducible genes activator, partial [Alphaproteobacteria bacterium]|nr:hydrogen peroxide-inducible genes activator [Alphaproteobacteria bacterium]
VVDRGARTARLSPLGRETLARARVIIAEAEQIVSRARSLGQPLTGPLRLGVIPTIAPYFLPRLLPVLQKKYPALELQLHEDMTARLVASLQSGALDVLLIALPYKAPGMTQELLFAEDFMLACPKGMWAAAPPVKTDQLKGRDLLLLEDGHCLRDHALAACRLQPVAEKKAFSATSLPTLIQMVRHGYGMTILPAMAVESVRQQDNIDIFPFRAPVPQREIGLAWRAGNPRVAEFKMLAAAARKA